MTSRKRFRRYDTVTPARGRDNENSRKNKIGEQMEEVRAVPN